MNSEQAAAAAAMSYKLRKEAFVSNLSGSTITDVNLVTLVAASAVLLYTALQKRRYLYDTHPIFHYIIDFLLNVCAVLFAFTVYASVPIFLNILLAVPAALLLLPFQTSASPRKTKTKTKVEPKHVSSKADDLQQDQKIAASTPATPLQPGTLVVRPFLTTYRGAMLVATFVAILAVDFPIFPRRFAKVETWGTSLMDLGVGSFVFSAGVVSARMILRGPSVQQQTAAEVARRIMQAFRHSIPLLVLGLARLISVKNLDYAEHVTEYGVHWNFFFTLALLSPFVESIDRLLSLLGLSSPSLMRASVKSSLSSKPQSTTTTTTSPQPRKRSTRYDIVALLISLTYEIILNNTGLLSFILISPRTPQSSLLVKNREGVFSFFGYLAVFLSGRSTGILVCQFHHDAKTASSTPTNKKRTVSPLTLEAQQIAHERKTAILPALAFRALVYAVLYWLSSSVYAVNLTVSRRLANLPYVLWIAAFNNAQLLLFALIEMVGPAFTFSKQSRSNDDDDNSDSENVPREASQVPSRIMRALNRNGLVVFLVANLLTGLVNFTVNTLDASSAMAMAVQIPYAAAITGVALVLDYYGITIKM